MTPMNILYVYAHPYQNSLNAELMHHGVKTLQSTGHHVMLSDLYADEFSIETEQLKIARADHIIFQFPLWWFSMPATMKDWMDRVFTKGFAYDAGKTFVDGLLRGKTAALVITMQSPFDAYKNDGIHGHELDNFLLPIQHTLRFTGIENQASFTVYDAHQFDEARFQSVMVDYKNYLANYSSLQSRRVY